MVHISSSRVHSNVGACTSHSSAAVDADRGVVLELLVDGLPEGEKFISRVRHAMIRPGGVEEVYNFTLLKERQGQEAD